MLTYCLHYIFQLYPNFVGIWYLLKTIGMPLRWGKGGGDIERPNWNLFSIEPVNLLIPL